MTSRTTGMVRKPVNRLRNSPACPIQTGLGSAQKIALYEGITRIAVTPVFARLPGNTYLQHTEKNGMDTPTLIRWQERFTEYVQTRLPSDDGSHDIGHFRRVWNSAYYIREREFPQADALVLLAAAYFHDFVSFPKNDPRRSESSRFCAEKTGEILASDFPDFPADKIGAVQHAIHAHSFSAGVTPLSPEADILQDADRLEALGALGVARTFYVAGSLHTSLFDADDPLARQRGLDDRRFALDHFSSKLLKLPALMRTRTGKHLAADRAKYVEEFMQQMAGELEGPSVSENFKTV